MQKVDKIEIEILADGTLKMTTDKISAPNHGNFEALIREINTMMGGEVTSKQRHGTIAHTHTTEQGKTITHSH